jgi:hypothetical protein
VAADGQLESLLVVDLGEVEAEDLGELVEAVVERAPLDEELLRRSMIV